MGKTILKSERRRHSFSSDELYRFLGIRKKGKSEERDQRY